MNASRLQLEGYYTRELHFRIKQDIEEETEFIAQRGLGYIPLKLPEVSPLTINISAHGGASKEDHSRWKFELTIISENPKGHNYPYEFKVSLVGYFKANFEDPTGKDQTAIRTNAISLLFSTAREVLAGATSRSPFPAAILPVVSFINSPMVTGEKLPEAKEKVMKSLPRKPKGSSQKSNRAKKSGD